ncbi:UDP-diphosphatase [Candidatus Woesearchaeota archaeon CG10_big_fil_rev_8_21_14_0_10_34_12]|nr:MAG: UDP-diphosphatase [Candidatus Woesearchaeota archaeon CG10_big_fil_rev_8_21_14_0_10_34_12]
MLNEVILAIVQGITEFLPVSSSGHLALVSNLISQPNLFFFTALHLASLLAVLIFTRDEIKHLIKFDKDYRKIWIFLIIATIPSGIVGYYFKDVVEKSFSSFFFLGFAFIFTGFVLFRTRTTNPHKVLNSKNSLLIGLSQALALFPGISRSGMTISTGLFSGIDREKAVKFSFLMFVPVCLGAFVLELGSFYLNSSLLVAFILCFLVSLLSLNVLIKIVKKNYLWVFSFYCFLIGILSFIVYFRA